MSFRLDFQNVIFSYDSEFTLGPVDLCFNEGKITVILGRSGSGKSTVLRLAAGLLEPHQGQIQRPNSLVSHGRTSLYSMVFQDYVLYPHLKVSDNVTLPFQVSKDAKADRLRKAQDLLPRLRLTHLWNRKIWELSGGERQRVAILKVIVSGAPIWLMDEPLSNLDERHRLDLRSVIYDKQRESGATLLYVTHELPDAFAMADMLVVVENGAILQSGPVPELLDHPQDLRVGRFLSSPPANELPGHLETKSGQVQIAFGEAGSIFFRKSSNLAENVREEIVALVSPEDVVLGYDYSGNVPGLQIVGTVNLVEIGQKRCLIECQTSLGIVRLFTSRDNEPRRRENLHLFLPQHAFRIFDASTNRPIHASVTADVTADIL